MSEPLRIELRNGAPAEERTRAALLRLTAADALEPWMWTHDVLVEERARPHSHPVLTLNTQYEHDERMLLAEFVHEQLHWFEEAHAEQRDRAVERTVELYPSVPIDPPEGSGDERSTRLHLLVCYLEYEALKYIVGDKVAHAIMDARARHHYRWVYRTVLSDEARIREVIQAFGFWPDPLRRPHEPPMKEELA